MPKRAFVDQYIINSKTNNYDKCARLLALTKSCYHHRCCYEHASTTHRMSCTSRRLILWAQGCCLLANLRSSMAIPSEGKDTPCRCLGAAA